MAYDVVEKHIWELECRSVCFRPWLKEKLIKHFLPLGFLFVLVVALIYPTPGEKVKEWEVGIPVDDVEKGNQFLFDVG